MQLTSLCWPSEEIGSWEHVNAARTGPIEEMQVRSVVLSPALSAHLLRHRPDSGFHFRSTGLGRIVLLCASIDAHVAIVFGHVDLARKP